MTRLVCALLVAIAASPVSVSEAIALPGRIQPNVIPFEHPEEWPYLVDSEHFVVHYITADEIGDALAVLGDFEEAYEHMVETLGAPAPLGDGGLAGPDERVDCYLWRGSDHFDVEAVAGNDLTPEVDDVSTYIVIDPLSPYAATPLERAANMYHELRHSIQAVSDWWEDYTLFEADATLYESRRFGFARLAYVWNDYQARPDWMPFRYDGYRTWHMYGAALYFDFVSRDTYDGDLAFMDEMWARSANPPVVEEFGQQANEPDFADALGVMLAHEGTSFEASLIGFSRARWYTGSRDIGLFTEGAVIGEIAPTLHVRGKSARSSQRLDAMVYGSRYLRVKRGPNDGAEIRVSLQANGQDAARFALQTVGRGDDDRALDVSRPARVRFQPDGTATLALTVLPTAANPFDPDERDDTSYSVVVVLDRL